MHSFLCPHCGPRDETEFLYGGDAGRVRPPRTASDEEWARYRYFRKNVKGAARELWLHRSGCGRWLVLERDTVTHAVKGSEGAAP